MANHLKLGIAGTGAIGAKVAREVARGNAPGFHLTGLATSSQARLETINAALPQPVPRLSFDDLATACDWVLEALPANLFADLAYPVLSAGKTLVVLSCSQLLEHGDVVAHAREHGGRIVVPSGAMLGLDAIKAAACGTLKSVKVETRKPVASLSNAPFLVNRGIDLSGITDATKVIEGNVIEVAREFPANVNVAAAIGLAGLGPEHTYMEIWADPTVDRNTHTVHVVSDSSDFTMTIRGRPSEENPATGRITQLSVLALLKNHSATLQIGT